MADLLDMEFHRTIQYLIVSFHKQEKITVQMQNYWV